MLHEGPLFMGAGGRPTGSLRVRRLIANDTRNEPIPPRHNGCRAGLRVRWVLRGVPSMTSLFRRRRPEPNPAARRARADRYSLAACLDAATVMRSPASTEIAGAACARWPSARHHGDRSSKGSRTAVGTPAPCGQSDRSPSDPNGRPDLNDRTPSLVNWISRELDTHIRDTARGDGARGRIGDRG